MSESEDKVKLAREIANRSKPRFIDIPRESRAKSMRKNKKDYSQTPEQKGAEWKEKYGDNPQKGIRLPTSMEPKVDKPNVLSKERERLFKNWNKD
jgi:hypothetical protein